MLETHIIKLTYEFFKWQKTYVNATYNYFCVNAICNNLRSCRWCLWSMCLLEAELGCCICFVEDVGIWWPWALALLTTGAVLLVLVLDELELVLLWWLWPWWLPWCRLRWWASGTPVPPGGRPWGCVVLSPVVKLNSWARSPCFILFSSTSFV